MTNLYDDLGIPPHATPDMIRKAFRSLAQKLHPDKETGDEEAYKIIQKAYDVLSDVERRRLYDETGDTATPLTERQQAEAACAELMMDVIDRIDGGDDNDADVHDPIKAARKQMHTQIAVNTAHQEKQMRRIRQHEKVIKRLRRTAQGGSILHEASVGAIVRLKDDIKKGDEANKRCHSVLDVLAEYEYEVDAAAVKRRQQAEAAKLAEKMTGRRSLFNF